MGHTTRRWKFGSFDFGCKWLWPKGLRRFGLVELSWKFPAQLEGVLVKLVDEPFPEGQRNRREDRNKALREHVEQLEVVQRRIELMVERAKAVVRGMELERRGRGKG
jgi:hypothetical protein